MKRRISVVLLAVLFAITSNISFIYAEDSECDHNWYCSWNVVQNDYDDEYHKIEWYCSLCGAKKYEKQRHIWDNSEYIYDDNNNFIHTLYYCQCGASEIEHHYNWDSEEYEALDANYHQKIVSCGCGEKVVYPKEEHNWGDGWTEVTKATIFNKGQAQRKCTLCDTVQTKELLKIDPFAKFKAKTFSVIVKKSIDMKEQVLMGNGDAIKNWKVNKKSIASISRAGKLKTKKTGKVTVTVALKSGKKATCTVKVTKPKAEKVYWTPHGSVYHKSKDCPTLARSKKIKSGTIKKSKKKRCCKVCG